jgi:hypothetical protein
MVSARRNRQVAPAPGPSAVRDVASLIGIDEVVRSRNQFYRVLEIPEVTRTIETEERVNAFEFFASVRVSE